MEEQEHDNAEREDHNNVEPADADGYYDEGDLDDMDLSFLDDEDASEPEKPSA